MRRLSEIVGAGLGYYALAWAGLWLAIEPGYASPVWPAAGLAIALVVACGWHVLIGTTIAHFAINLTLGPAPVALQIALGGLLGLTIARLLLSGDIPVASLTRLYVACTAAAVISAVVGVDAIGASGPRWALSIIVWGVGDLVGMLAVAPALLVALDATTARSWFVAPILAGLSVAAVAMFSVVKLVTTLEPVVQWIILIGLLSGGIIVGGASLASDLTRSRWTPPTA